MTNDFSEIKEGLSRKFEDLLIEVSEVKTPKCRVIFADQLPLINEFKEMIDKIEWSYLTDKVADKNGEDSNED